MIKRMILMLLVVGVILGGVFGFEAFRTVMIKRFFASHGAPPQTVATAAASSQEWQPQLEAVGSLRAVNGADLSLEVAGIVDAIHFKSGDEVQAGALLLTLRADTDVAQLHALEAMAELANVNYQRDLKQLKVQAVSQATVDTDQANLKNAQALVAQQKAAVEKKMLRAPFAGRLGIRLVDLGQFINAGTPVVTLQALDPIYVDFYLPQQSISQLRVGQQVTAKVDAFPRDLFGGAIVAISPEVDAATRNVQIRAALKNPDHRLLPGMYATVDVASGAPQRYVTLPQTAITYNSYGNTVFLVEEKGQGPDGKPQLVARQSFINTGPTRGDQVAVLNGIKEGDMVVVAGQFKLRNGTTVLIDNSVKPTADASPNLPPTQ
jgi:membrane fusion protein (multidrug efflux system)